MKEDMINGEQPCNNFKPQSDGNEYAEWDNLHQCPKCGKTRSFCLNCYWDHHEDGWQTCANNIALRSFVEELKEMQEDYEEELEDRFNFTVFLGDQEDLLNKNVDVEWFECGNCHGEGKHKLYEDIWDCPLCFGQGGRFVEK